MPGEVSGIRSVPRFGILVVTVSLHVVDDGVGHGVILPIDGGVAARMG